MTLLKKMLGAAATVAASASFAVAEPALIFDLGGKFDKSFNELAFTGAQRWAEDTGMTFRDIELQSEAQREQALRRFAEAGNNPIVMTGFAFASALGDVAAFCACAVFECQLRPVARHFCKHNIPGSADVAFSMAHIHRVPKLSARNVRVLLVKPVAADR